MPGNLKYCISMLQDNEERVKLDAQRVLLRLCNNILSNPEDSRYRKVRLANAVIATKLLPASGAIECLFEAGFVESDDGFLLPTNASLAGVKELHSLLDNTAQRTQSCATKDSKEPPLTSVERKMANEPTTNCRKQENTFFVHLMGHFQSVLRYEDKALQDKVRSMLPLETLQISAMKKLREIQKEVKMRNLQNDVVFEDLLLTELLSWFKFKFFKWVDTLVCRNCKGECYNDGSRVSSNSRISRIEIHKCRRCNYENEFARYTDPEVLLCSRKGRCGEWANCFTLICRSVGLDARLVYDETDHVWTEVWSVAHNRWIHADACENVMDRPLMYEKGWGKKLSYVIAFSRDEIQDVTWRYTRDHEQVIKRRKHCTEEALAMFVRNLNEERQTRDGYSSARRNFVTKRYALELAEMIVGPPGRDSKIEDDYGGRTSGSIAWRISRGEVGRSKYTATQWYIPQGISRFQLRYDVLDDVYTTIDGVKNKILEKRRKWLTGIEQMEGSIFRKDEPDWKMIYLARSPGTKTGKITWTLAIQDSAKSYVNSVKLQAVDATYSGATVKWQVEALLLHSKDNAKLQKKVATVSNCKNFEMTNLTGAVKISVSATLSGGQGEIAWQHAQLFRESITEPTKRPSLFIQVDVVDRDQA